MAEKPTYEELELRVKELEMDLRDGKQAEEILQEAQNIRQLLKFAPFGVYLIDLSGKIVACNESGAGRLGKTIETSIGTVLRDFFPAEVAENKRLKGMEAIQSRQAVTFDDQTEGRWYRNSIFPIFDNEGRPVRLAIYGADVTKYKNALDLLEKSEERYRQLADLLPQIVFETDEKGNLTFTNLMAFDLFGYTSADFEKGLNAPQMLMPEDRERAVRNMQTALRGEKLGGIEYTARTKDGRTFPVMIYSHPIIKEGKPAGLRGIMVDITEGKRDREALNREKEKFRVLVEESPLGISLIGKDGRYEYLNPRFTEIFGYNLEDIPTGREWFRKTYPDQEYRRQVICEWINNQKEAEVGEARPRTYVATCKDGSEKTINFRPVMLETGEQFVIYDNITEEKRAEDALRESEERYRTLVDNLPVGVYRNTPGPEGEFLMANPAFCKMFGFKDEEEVKKVAPSELYEHPEERKEYSDNLIQKGVIKNDERTLLKRDGTPVYTSITSRVVHGKDGGVSHFDSIMLDITQQKIAEEALRASEDKYRNLVEESFDGIFIQRGPSIIFANKRLNEMLGYREGELIGQNHWEVYHPDYQKTTRERAEARMLGEEVVSRYEVKLQRKDGSWFYGEINARPITFPSDEESGIQVWVKDIDERKRAEDALRASEERYRKLIEASNDGIAIIRDDKHLYVNQRFLDIFGYDTPQEVLGKSFFVSVHPDDLERVTDLASRRQIGDPVPSRYEFKGRRKNGQEVFIEVSAAKTIYKGESVSLAYLRDVTERRHAEKERTRLEAQLQQAHKMEAMGLLAGGVAHDLNNILSGIVSYPELLLMDLPEDSPLRKPIQTIQESGMRAADVVADLLTIARGVATGKEALNLNRIVSEYLGSAEFDKLEKTHAFVDFRTELDSDLLNISGSSIHIKKVLMNLVVNATEAIEGSGSVIISTGNRYLDEPVRGYDDVRQGEYVVLSVSDNGSGISPEDMERIFEPFYTKKVMGRSGTGLGLAVVWNTVQDHHGYIRVKSSEKGTAFELYFPVTREKIADEKEPVDLQDYLGHGEKILVVDDEERQREIACGMLTKLGYNPESVSSGEEAIEYVKEHPVDLIILDMIMPKGINGRETYEEIIRIRPGQKAVIASGFAKTREVDSAQDLGAGKYIKKPYMLEKIGIAVKRELEK